MKSVKHVNLGGHAIIIDEDAHEHLDLYLKSVDRSFAHLEGRAEILQDIELRIAELLQEQLKGRSIVSIPDVDAIIKIMGQPQDFSDSDTFESSEAKPLFDDYHRKDEGIKFRPGKKLFRDPDNKIIGGVCAGISSYLGISDPVWVRLIFVLMFLGGGFGGMIYLILLIVVPKATTAADKLAMKGEEVNISSIAKAVEDQIQELSDRLTELGDDLRGKKSK
jgi:phage shock protein PspC (stress-responsive transcriptional regulator)